MSVKNKSIRDLLAGKELIGFRKSPADGDRTVERASSAKVTVIKTPKSEQGVPTLQRASTAKIGIPKSPR